MSKKRLTFDIDLPEEDTFPAGKDHEPEAPTLRRGPMATAIIENAESLRARQEIEARIRAENDALAEEHVRLKRLGLVTELVPLELIEISKLSRDRAPGEDPELVELVASIREIGLSNPIRLEVRDDGRYELVQGFRRLSAFRMLLEETGDQEQWGAIPSAVMPLGDTIEMLYRRMVDENMVRKDISFAEMAAMAINYAKDPATSETDPDRAVAQLFKSAGYQKRSYIRGFIRLMERLGNELKFPQDIPRALGLTLSAELEAKPEQVTTIRDILRRQADRTSEQELMILREFVGGNVAPQSDVSGPRPRQAAPGRAKTIFQVASRMGTAKCAAAQGRLEIRLDRDFSALDRKRLEAAVAAMLNDLE